MKVAWASREVRGGREGYVGEGRDDSNVWPKVPCLWGLELPAQPQLLILENDLGDKYFPIWYVLHAASATKMGIVLYYFVLFLFIANTQ